ncbi:transcriptional regulator [Thermosipho ferrireducens]|uniref:Transcriptional regulator n=1 Tax=Thermosipho ferrireducens TaxID=2571116 RepID=A0ABX7S822_9BACT|nr:transcriptional regulator [Thermosipho ferrireducens]QTA38742.1 transcriptional regulator [Thermosipho ferrireducens]
MNELLKIIASPQLFEVLYFLKNNPNQNPSTIARKLGFHTFTVQRYLEVLEKFGIVSSKIEKKIGRPSKKYTYVGGTITIDINDILKIFELKSKKFRMKTEDLKYSYNLKKEIINGVIYRGKKIEFSESEGKILFLIPPSDSSGISAKEIFERIKMSEFDILCIIKKLIDLDLIEVID